MSEPSLRLAGRSIHEAIARMASTRGKLTLPTPSPLAVCEMAAPVKSKKMPA